MIENENKPDDKKDGKKPQEDDVIENEEKPDDEKDEKNFQEDEVIENEEKKGDNKKDKEDSVLKGKVIEQHHRHDNEEEEKKKGDDVTEENDGVIELHDGHDKEEKTKCDVTEENEGLIQQCDGHDKEEEEKKSDVTQKEAHVDSGGQQAQVEQISARQFYKRTQTLLRAVRKQQQEDAVSGKQSPDECTVKIGRRSICITDKVTEKRSEIRQVYSCRLALQFKS